MGHEDFNNIFIKKSNCNMLNNQICIIKTFQNNFFLIYLLKYYFGLGLYDFIKKQRKYYKYLHKGALLCINKYYKNNQFYILTSSIDNSVNIYNFKETEIKIIAKINNVWDNKNNINIFTIDSVLLINNNHKDYLITTNCNDKYIKIYNIFNLNNNDYLNNKNKLNIQIQSKYFSERGVFYINTIYHNIKKTNYLVILCINFVYNKFDFRNRSLIDIIDFNTYEKYDNNNSFSTNRVIRNIEIYEENNKKFIYFVNNNEVYRYDFYEKILSSYKIENKIYCICLFDKKRLIYCNENKIVSLRVLGEEKFDFKGEKIEKKFNDKVYNITAEKLWDDKIYLFVHLKDGSLKIYHYWFYF